MTERTTNLDITITEQARDWVLRLASGEMDAAELDRLRAWLDESDLHARAFEQRRALWLELGEHPELFVRTAPPAARHRRREVRRLNARRRVGVAVATVAASLLGVIAAPELMLRMKADHHISAGVAEYHLPDGSSAWLDAGSAISVDFDAAERKITLLRGNAFFAVRHDERRPFRVAALRGVVEDIGTSFEVRHQPERVDVAVAEGAVRVASRSDANDAITLHKGETAGYAASGMVVRKAPAAPVDIAAWRRHELLIDRQPLSGAIREIARYRNGPTWIWADLSGRGPVNGAFRIDDGNTALRDLAASQGLTVTWLPGDIAIVRTGNAGGGKK